MSAAREFAHKHKLIVAMYPVLQCMHRDHNTDCDAATVAIEQLLQQAREDIAAYLLDRADQIDNETGDWIPLADAAKAIMAGDVEAAIEHGELQETELRRRVRAWRK